jgi:L-threonylcarbamoyladenylate synthase
MPGSSSNANGPLDDRIAAAAQTLARGGIVVYPTETLYALGADAFNAAALQRLVDLKVREHGKPIAVLINDMDMLDGLVSATPLVASALMQRFWPGPLTLVLPARAGISPVLTGGQGGIGVRLSSHPMATVLVRTLGRPVTAPSANPAGLSPPLRAEEARAYFGARVDHYLDGGEVPGGPASTVADVRGELKIIREGVIRAADLYACVG